MESESIKDIEIFRTGTHNGDEYTTSDLDQMVQAAKDLDFRPALKIGHTKDTPGAPAYGWVQNLRRVGSKLLADFTDMHASVIEAIRKKAYDRVSAEIYFNLKRNGKTFAHALKAVALLGAEVPAVANLTPLHKMEFADLSFERQATASEQPLDADTIGMTVHNRVVQYRRLHPGIKTYSEALKGVLAEDTALHRSYVSGIEPVDTGTEAGNLELEASPGWRIAKLMRAEMERHQDWDQMTCLKKVLEQHPDLAEDYRKHPTLASNLDAVMGSDRSRGI